MTTLQLEGDPGDVGMSAERLARIDTHFRKYVDDGHLSDLDHIDFIANEVAPLLA